MSFNPDLSDSDALNQAGFIHLLLYSDSIDSLNPDMRSNQKMKVTILEHNISDGAQNHKTIQPLSLDTDPRLRVEVKW